MSGPRPDFSDVRSTGRPYGSASPFVVRSILDNITWGLYDQIDGRRKAVQAGYGFRSPEAQQYVREAQGATDAEFDQYPGRVLASGFVDPTIFIPGLVGAKVARKAAQGASRAGRLARAAGAGAGAGAVTGGAYEGVRSLGEDPRTAAVNVGAGVVAGGGMGAALGAALPLVGAGARRVANAGPVRELLDVLRNPNYAGSVTDAEREIFGASPQFVSVRPTEARPATFPNREVAELARQYVQQAGIQGAPMRPVTAIDQAFAKRMADAYEALESRPNDPEVRAAYKALVDETRAQAEALQKAGLRFEFVKEDPYKNSREMMEDVAKNRRLRVFASEEGGHPVMTPEENNLFRAVHDLFGHTQSGYQFGPKGEEGAFRDHAAMFSPLARRAMATETRGQNSWVNFGPFAAENKAKPGSYYAPQKAALWPDDLMVDY